MSGNLQDQYVERDFTERQWQGIYIMGGIATILVLMGTLLDMFVGFGTGGDLALIPRTAVERFAQFQDNWLLGLYNLDLLNVVNSSIMIPAIFALYAVHRRTNRGNALLAMIIFLTGTSIFLANNTALPMLELSRKYVASISVEQKAFLAAAGEAMLARGAHGSPGVFLGFALTLSGEIIMSFTMLKGKVFGKLSAWTGILGSTLLFVYIVLVTFVPEVKTVAMLLAAPGGILAMIWMALFTIRLFRLGRLRNSET